MGTEAVLLNVFHSVPSANGCLDLLLSFYIFEAQQMATVSLNEINTVDDLKKYLNDNEQKLIVIQFSLRYPERRDFVENSIRQWITEYSNRVLFVKCNVQHKENRFKTEYNIQNVPTYILFQNNKEVARLTNTNEDELKKAINQQLPQQN
ncbi:unnamed protein product [Didymodactylos carnosus]|uniref:Thioredoxin domain-containing protein n=1 Tax=Didymodactylos carnosus TaxID=1234261 RepID=A0A814VAX4_9BILA|nr:unnamed protein product [Didymodactylos carnosus]CAF1185660.1 unnamed protein product [Didymodactylos carnosus]CAF3855224.1 unnamed protein product [Didymodactylos carnosus]CAF3949922.1 unnamed protein product [Didymodactylos carnosus]